MKAIMESTSNYGDPKLIAFLIFQLLYPSDCIETNGRYHSGKGSLGVLL